jgi:hypothetical protein
MEPRGSLEFFYIGYKYLVTIGRMIECNEWARSTVHVVVFKCSFLVYSFNGTFVSALLATSPAQ